MNISRLVVYLELGVLGFVLVVLAVSALDRSSSREQRTGEVAVHVQQEVPEEESPPVQQQVAQSLPEIDMDVHVKPRTREIWQGDLDGLLKREKIRILVPFSRTFFLPGPDNGRGLRYEALKLYERFINETVALGSEQIKLVFLLTPQERLKDDLLAGIGDIAAADMTVMTVPPEQEEQEKQIAFSEPLRTDINEVVVTGRNAPQFKSIFNLSGLEVTVRKNSGYIAGLQELNSTLKSIGKKPVKITTADDFFEDEDLLEMINAGLLPMTVMDSHVAEFWAGVLHNLKVQKNIRLRTAKETAWAVRADSPLLKESINYFRESVYRPRTGSPLLTAYYRSREGYLQNNLSGEAVQRFNSTVGLLKKYGRKYDLPYLLVAALAYQESQLDQAKRGRDGAVGILQVRPAAAEQVGVRHIEELEENIRAGCRYLRLLADSYFSSPELTPLDRNLMTVAAYRAGPEVVMAARKEAALSGYNPDIWFNHAETAMSVLGKEDISRYVRNIYLYMQVYEDMLAETENGR
ncbi:MAG: transglycosylase SLT domain-containing protein [Candidatus Electrothrix sp. YB6]